ncbi:MAG: ferrous iron transport protein B [Paludibacteraceae bacterium]|nr:ferrous iron transport protein B [Paludibacteraceae bacterium]
MESKEKKLLLDVEQGKECIVYSVKGQGGFRHRVMEMGFVRGERVKVIKNAPFHDPIEFKIMQSHVSLRRTEAAHIEVVDVESLTDDEKYSFQGTISEDASSKSKSYTDSLDKTITVALVGNPNCGKTSLFNHATGLHEHVGNYSGVTVSSKTGTFYHKGYTINLVDLPGTYSITEYSPEELYVREYITEQHPDMILNVVDTGNLARNMFLTTQLIDMNVRMVMALNMYDVLERTGSKLDIDQLEKIIGFPCVPTIAKTGEGITHVLDHIVNIHEEKETLLKHIHINYGTSIEKEIEKIKPLIASHNEIAVDYPFRYIILKLLEGDKHTEEFVKKSFPDYEPIRKQVEESREAIAMTYDEDIASVITNAKYGFIRGALNETLEWKEGIQNDLEYKADRILTHKWLGFPFLLLFLFLMFEATFQLGAYPQGWIESLVSLICDGVKSVMPEGMLADLIVDGIIAGVGGVIVFLPNILILFFFIAILEDTGYMARAAFIMDRVMHKVGLHGKSFIPMLSGFGCAVPAIMATRTLENPKDRIITMMAIPFMSCSARLPVYLLLVSAFFSEKQGLMLFLIYLIGIFFAILTALLLKKTKFKNNSEEFVMELPPYRIPTWRSVLIHMWDKAVQYLKKMGTVILLASIILWALNYFPSSSPELDEIDAKIAQVDEDSEEYAELTLLRSSVQSENSYIGSIGKFIAPVFKPLGFDWKTSVSILTGLAAKEIVVSSMGILYQADGEANEESEKLVSALQNVQYQDGTHVFTPVVAFSLILFILLCSPCIAAVTALAKESTAKWAAFAVCYTTLVAWIVSFAFYQIANLIG